MLWCQLRPGLLVGCTQWSRGRGQRQRSVVFGRRWLRGSLLLFISHVMLVDVLCVVVVEYSMLCANCSDAVVPVASGAARAMYSMEPWLAQHSQALDFVRLCAW